MGSGKVEKSRVSLVALAVMGAGIGALGCRAAAADAKPRAEEPAAKVETVAVGEQELPRFLTLTGTLVANQKADVAADVVGKVQRTYVERGSLVQKGSLLASIDAHSLTLSQAEAKAEMRSAEARSELAKNDCGRTEKLFREGSVSRAEFERQSAQCETTQWSKEAAVARAHRADKSLGDSSIRAPFSGLVVERFVAPGEYVRPDTRVVTLVDVDTLRLELTVPEAAVGSVEEGQTVTFRLTSNADQEFPAKVRYIGPALRRASRDQIVEAVLDNRDHKLRPGMFVAAKIELGKYSAPVVPLSALREEGAARRLFVVSQSKLEERVVETGDQMGGMVAILRGVEPGERIVRSVGSEVKDGIRVE